VRAPLAGLTVAVTADRRWEEQGDLLARRGARVLHAATIRTLALTADDGARRATEALIEEPPELLVLTTGIGTRGWFELADSIGLGDALVTAIFRAEVVVRGPKANGAALMAGLNVAWQAPSATSAELVTHLGRRGVRGCRVAVQLDGRDAPVLADQIRALGAEVVEVPVYRWTQPEEPEPAMRLLEAIVEQRIDAVTFTSSPAAWNLAHMADAAGLRKEVTAALTAEVNPVSVGPVCSAALEALGWTPVVEPSRARLGAMVQAYATWVEQHRPWTPCGSFDLRVGAAAVDIGDEVIDLAPRERAVLALLAERPGVVVSKERLLDEVWSGQEDEHVVEVTVARLRRRLRGPVAVETVSRRGYRLGTAPAHTPPERT
jgi:uroporphyrinogen-III synthase